MQRTRNIFAYLVIGVILAGCQRAAPPVVHVQPLGTLLIRQSPSPFTEVSAWQVSAFIPDDWRPRLAGRAGGAERGFIASPQPRAWAHSKVAEGMTAVWIDSSDVGVPSDYYYLTATGPALDRLTRSPECRDSSQVLADHRPSFVSGSPGSPGDYVAVGQGICLVHRTPTRFAYFVAAPGYGPVRRLGIPSSGLYVVVAVLPDSPGAPKMLDSLLFRTRFGNASVGDFIAAVKAAHASAT